MSRPNLKPPRRPKTTVVTNGGELGDVVLLLIRDHLASQNATWAEMWRSIFGRPRVNLIL
jgi:hypothetical protein